MSNHLAIATVTAALGQLVTNAVDSTGISFNLDYGRPNNSTSPHPSETKVHVTLYQVTYNPARRNDDAPTRDAAGNLVARPRVALDLHYLLTFYGDNQSFAPERMLGAVVRDLHETPILTGKAIRSVVSSPSFSTLATSDLADALDRVRFTPALLSVDELSKLWSVFFQTPYALSVAYTASVVLIDAIHGGARAAPVLHRGEDDRGASAQVNATSPFPWLESLHIGEPSPAELATLPRSYPAAVVGNMLVLRGMNLMGEAVKLHLRHLRFADPEHPQHWQLPPLDPDRHTESELRFTLSPTAIWRVGTYAVTVQVLKEGKWHKTNELLLQLAPRISHIAPAVATGAAGSHLVVTLTCQPAILDQQTVELVLAEASHDTAASSRSPTLVDSQPSSTLVFTVNKAPVTQQSLVRIRVDGVESVPYAWQGNPAVLTIIPNQTLTITANG